MNLKVDFKKAVSYGLVAGIVLGSAAISASAVGFGKQFFTGQGFGLLSAQTETVQGETGSDEAAAAQGTEVPSAIGAPPAPAEGDIGLGGAVPAPAGIAPDGAAAAPGMMGGRRMGGGKGMVMNPDTLVQDGVIDQATADRMKEYIANRKDMLSEMVADGVITQAQADAISAAQEAKAKAKSAVSPGGITWKGESGRGGFGKGVSGIIGFGADALVESGVLDQATADRVKEFIDQEKAALAEEKEKLANMSAEERKEYLADKVTNAPKDTVSRLVEEGILTQEQADAIKNAIPARTDRRGARGGERGQIQGGALPDEPTTQGGATSTVSLI